LAFVLPTENGEQKTISPLIEAVLISTQSKALEGVTCIRVTDVRMALEEAKNLLYIDSPEPIRSDAKEIKIGAHSIVSEDATIGHSTVIGNHVVIGPGVVMGIGCSIGDGVQIYARAQIGNHVHVKANSVIGGDGFGYYFDGSYQKIRHVGSVIIEDEVHIGSNCCIDRGTINNTVIKKGAKLDNLVHVAHNVVIEEGVAIAAQSGISGSSVIGEYSQLGGQVGVVGHIKIAPGSRIQAQSGVASSISESKQKWYGYPAMKYWDYLRSFSIFRKLPSLEKRLKDLEDRIKSNSNS